ncbi:BlaR1 family beta-lactam sensor/signal transducer [Anaerostipes sp.]|uniref:BlaR1 family beta-lactam sensor/signal transducer n=1 Tax=Anaerostipes sp. TaxID=1872530 RepID=UPI0025BF7C5C|nr:BlaR1 family beta-lactam sensor/signal transducer [Anaerostipes sp.]MBS7007728.1 BlaR1 family beta-lactam sensor/signal transducer [Anaerostipes sp.]
MDVTLVKGFLIHCLFLAFATPVILAAKKLFRRCLTLQSQHSIWYLYCFATLFFFLPIRLPSAILPFSPIDSFLHNAHESTGAFSSFAAADSAGWMNDYAVSAGSSFSDSFLMSLFWIWAAGAVIMTLVLLYSRIRLNRLGRSMAFIKNREAERLFTRCRKDLGIQRSIRFVLSEKADSPMAFGMLFPVIVFPRKCLSAFSPKELSYIFYHELSHYKRGDLVCNFVCCMVQALYWFHPAVLFSLRKMRTDREIACDASVLNYISEHERKDYGHTILNFAGYFSCTGAFSVSSGIGGSNSQLKQRITAIASYRIPSFRKRLASIVFLLVFGLLFSSFFLKNNIAAGSVSKAPDRPFVNADLSSYFSGKEGCFVLYDKNHNKFRIYNDKMSRRRVSPDSTYKIYSALAALDAGVISPQKTSLSWDHKTYPYSSWNHDQTLDSAMESSVNWYFQKLDQKLGKTSVQNNLKRIGYGNEDISGGISSFWLESSLKISPLEQVMLLRDFDQNRLGYSKETVATVRNSMKLSSAPGHVLYGKTGTGRVDGCDINGWFIGFLKTKDNTFYFALRLQGADNASGQEAAKTALKIIGSMSL